ncbi:2445_t:CDS:2 [Entrophospora sp. SA101]|nr:2445_t:CDS:2 [Entrophospora sp. SA101]
MKTGANCEGWWTSEHLVKQIIEKAILIFEKLHPRIELVLEERNLWPSTKLVQICAAYKKHLPIQDSCCAVQILELQPDFVNQKSLTEETIESWS